MSVRSRFDQLAAEVEAACNNAGIPGAVTGVYFQGEVVAHGFGVTNLDHPLPVTEDTFFQIGSITKTYTAAALLSLSSDGLIDLDARVRAYLPEFRVADAQTSAEVTVRHLLTHTAGWAGDVFIAGDDNDSALASYVKALETTPQLFPLGALYSYNNAAFSVAGRLIEVVTGKVFEQAVKNLVFTPLGLSRSAFFASDIITHRVAVGHVELPEGHKVQRPWGIPRTASAAGGIVCDVHDLLRYAAFYMGDGGTLMKAALLQDMLTPRVPIWKTSGMGLSWFTSDTKGAKLIQHGGGTLGQVALLTIMPGENFAFAILANSTSALAMTEEASRKALKTFLELELPEPQVIDDPAFDLARFTGTYTRPAATITISLENGRLFATLDAKPVLEVETETPPPPPLTLGVCGDDRLMFLDGPYKKRTLDFIEREGGTYRWLRSSQRVHKKV